MTATSDSKSDRRHSIDSFLPLKIYFFFVQHTPLTYTQLLAPSPPLVVPSSSGLFFS